MEKHGGQFGERRNSLRWPWRKEPVDVENLPAPENIENIEEDDEVIDGGEPLDTIHPNDTGPTQYDELIAAASEESFPSTDPLPSPSVESLSDAEVLQERIEQGDHTRKPKVDWETERRAMKKAIHPSDQPNRDKRKERDRKGGPTIRGNEEL